MGADVTGPQGTGDCYQVAVKLVAMDDVFPSYLVCHGDVTGRGPRTRGVRFGHAWVEGDLGGAPTVFDYSNGGSHIIPRDDYYILGEIDPDQVRRYTAKEATVLMLRAGHFGPWEEDVDEGCGVCGSTETTELHDGERQSILVCANCGSDE
jgi:hypothetical protein